MFSGKTTELLRRVSCLEAIGKKILLINHSLDSRTDDSVLTHSNHKKKAIKISKLTSIIDKEYFKEARVIGIDEAQFFGDLREFILKIEHTNKIVYISGLDRDYLRKPFGQILQCIPLCDTITKLYAMDMISKDGSPAIFTKRSKQDLNHLLGGVWCRRCRKNLSCSYQNQDNQILIGNQDKYISVNRKNYLI